MNIIDPRAAARSAVAPNPSRPATALLLDSADARLIVFRIAPGQAVPPHQNPSTVMLHVLEGEGFVSGSDGERPCAAGDLVSYAPGEMHGMRATTTELQLLAIITPRPGARVATLEKGASMSAGGSL